MRPRRTCRRASFCRAARRGLRFRAVNEQDPLRLYMRFFVNGEQVFDLKRALRPVDAVQLVHALSGG
ncbi:hypothetical protein ACLESD_09840 [Pyxidicoccus sp. 3LFB2]